MDRFFRRAVGHALVVLLALGTVRAASASGITGYKQGQGGTQVTALAALRLNGFRLSRFADSLAF